MKKPKAWLVEWEERAHSGPWSKGREVELTKAGALNARRVRLTSFYRNIKIIPLYTGEE